MLTHMAPTLPQAEHLEPVRGSGVAGTRLPSLRRRLCWGSGQGGQGRDAGRRAAALCWKQRRRERPGVRAPRAGWVETKPSTPAEGWRPRNKGATQRRVINMPGGLMAMGCNGQGCSNPRVHSSLASAWAWHGGQVPPFPLQHRG